MSYTIGCTLYVYLHKFREPVIVLDVGRNTTEARCLIFCKDGDGNLRETQHHGINTGGLKVEREFEAMLCDIFGRSFIETFQKEWPEKWLDVRNKLNIAVIITVLLFSLFCFCFFFALYTTNTTNVTYTVGFGEQRTVCAQTWISGA